MYEKLYPMILILKLVSNETKKSRDKGEDWTLSGQHYPKYIQSLLIVNFTTILYMEVHDETIWNHVESMDVNCVDIFPFSIMAIRKFIMLQ